MSRFTHHLFSFVLPICNFTEVDPSLIYLIIEVKKNNTEIWQRTKNMSQITKCWVIEELIFLLKCECFKLLGSPQPVSDTQYAEV